MTLVIYWRHRHVTPQRSHALRDVIEAHPGDAEVIINLTGTGRKIRLAERVRPSASLFREIGKATEGACTINLDVKDPFR